MDDTKGFHLYDKWIRNIRNHHSIYSFLDKNLYSNIAVYGMGMIGRQLYDELEGTGITVDFGIDVKAENISYKDLPIICPEDIGKMREVSAIVVTPFDHYLEIERKLSGIVDTQKTDILSIQTIVELLYRGL